MPFISVSTFITGSPCKLCPNTEGEVTWWVGDLQIMRLNGALLNVLRTNVTDVNVTLRGNGKMFLVLCRTLFTLHGDIGLHDC
jgi:hypothetical protein